MQQPGGDSDQHHHASDGRQQFTHVYRGKVRFRAVLFNPFLTEGEVNNGDHHPHHAEGKRYAPAKTCGQPRGCQHREERTDVDGHVVHGKCTVQTWVVFVIAGRKQGGRVGFKQAVTDGDGRHTHIDDSGVMAGPGHQRIANRQHDSAQHDDTLGTQHFITQPAANGDEAINQRAKGGEQSNGIRFRHTQLFYQVNGHDPLQAVVTKTLPQLDRENEIERAWLFESVQTHAFCWFIVCSRHIYLFFYIPYLLGGVRGAISLDRRLYSYSWRENGK